MANENASSEREFVDVFEGIEAGPVPTDECVLISLRYRDVGNEEHELSFQPSDALALLVLVDSALREAFEKKGTDNLWSLDLTKKRLVERYEVSEERAAALVHKLNPHS